MNNLRMVLRGSLAGLAILCLVTFAIAQDQSSKPSSSSSSSSAQSGSASSGQLGAADKQFVMKAAEGGMAEVELGKVAADKATNPDVKQFGQRMVDDHSKVNDQLKSVAQQKGVTLPSDLNAKDKALKDKLSGMSGDQFDKTYMSHMLMDHKKDVAEFKKESQGAKDSDIKNFASQALPTLEDHLKMAQDITSKQKGTATQGKPAKKASTTAGNTPQ